MWKCQFREGDTVIDAGRTMARLSDHEQKCMAPKSEVEGDVAVFVSANGQQWHNMHSDVTFYNGPKVTSVTPTYGVVKNPNNKTIDIAGTNFRCPRDDCSKLKVRFKNKNGD